MSKNKNNNKENIKYEKTIIKTEALKPKTEIKLDKIEDIREEKTIKVPKKRFKGVLRLKLGQDEFTLDNTKKRASKSPFKTSKGIYISIDVLETIFDIEEYKDGYKLELKKEVI